MGIQGLLPQLKSIMVPSHIKDLKGCSVAVDTYSWLHKGALSCSKEICKGQSTFKHINYCMHRVNLLRHYGVNPILVFDGGLLPMKSEQENKRARVRKENLARATEHESNGNFAAAYESYQKAVDISPFVAYELIQVLTRENVSYVVAPYEADAQMTFLAVTKQVDAVITEDSDLIAFGCPRILYKMDKFGQGIEFQSSKLHANKELDFTGFSKQMLLQMCIFCGCDYLQSLPGMGVKRAHALIKKYKCYQKVIKHLKYSGVEVSPLYEESFRKATLTFQHQRVYDPVTEDIVHLSDLSDNAGEELDFLGPPIPQHIARGIARGDLDPFTKMPFKEEHASVGLLLDGTYQPRNFKLENRQKLDLPIQKNLLTNYFCFASLEAKRKFIAPRVTPKQPNGTYSGKFINEDANSSGRSAPETSAILQPLKDSVGDYVTIKASAFSQLLTEGVHGKGESLRTQQQALLQKPQHPIHKPCTSLQRESISYSAPDASKRRTVLRKGNFIVKSTYFQKNFVKENGYNKNETMLVAEEIAADSCENTISDHERESASDEGKGTMRIEPRNVFVKSPYFENKSKENIESLKDEKILVRDCFTVDKRERTLSEQEFKCAAVSGVGKTRIENGKLNMMSSYFLHNSVSFNNQGDGRGEPFIKDDLATDASENNMPASSSDIYDFESGIMKRKLIPVGSVQKDVGNQRSTSTKISVPVKSNVNSNLDNSDMEMEAEKGKFGCNISHLDQYSDIADRSMEKFVSVISSFRFSSSASHADGPHLPLKDVQNTCSNRSDVAVDLTKFTYVPSSSKRKAFTASSREYR